MEKVLVSACLVGSKVRYNGRDILCSSYLLKKWLQEGRVVSICPEVSAGLSIPRPPSEIVNGQGDDVLAFRATVIENSGQDVSAQFIKSAENTLKLCKDKKIRVAVLTESSPSCGSNTIYNGDFSNTKISGSGVTAALLNQHGIKVFSQHCIQEAADAIELLEDKNR